VRLSTTELAVGGNDRIVRIWNTRTGQLLHQRPDATGNVESMAFHPSGAKSWRGGQIVGTYYDAAYIHHGFLLDQDIRLGVTRSAGAERPMRLRELSVLGQLETCAPAPPHMRHEAGRL
jgi:hypothetical protein